MRDCNSKINQNIISNFNYYIKSKLTTNAISLFLVIEFVNNISVISCRSILLVKEIGVPEENHRPVASH
jgi:hypothetical protein